jgi:hypothetical protein
MPGILEMPTDAEIEYMNEVIADTQNGYYENEDGEIQPIHDGFEEQNGQVKE